MSGARYDDLQDRAAVVTGGASGIGEAIVRALAAQGCRVGFLDIQEAAGAALAAELGAEFVACDLVDVAALRRGMAVLAERCGPARVLVNNAANDRRQRFAEVEPAEFDWSMGVNLRHVYFASQAAVPGMRAAGGGSIVNMSSVAWMGGGRELQAYSAAKAAIVGFTNSLAREVGADRIRVNAVAPGMVITERQRRLWYEDEALIAAGRARQSLPDAITPEDVAGVVVFLASEASRMVTKECISVTGGSR